MEICRFENYILSCLVCSRTFTSEYSSDTHWLFCIADGKVVLTKYVLFAIESDERKTSILILYHNLISLNHVCVKAMEWLTVSHHDIVGDVHNIIDRTQADYVELVLKPFRRFLYFASSDANASIAFACLCVLDFYVDR